MFTNGLCACLCHCPSSCLTTSLSVFQDPSIRGIFHFSAKEQMTKYEMAVAIAQAFNLPSNHLIPVRILYINLYIFII